MGILIGICIIIYLFIAAQKVTALKQRVEKLEAEHGVQAPQTAPVSQMYPGMAHEQAPVATGDASSPPVVMQSSVVPPPVMVQPAPNPFMEWLKQDFFVKLGAFLLIIAISMFLLGAFTSNLIGPMGRIVLGLLVGTAFLVLGVRRIKTFAHQGFILTVLGTMTIILTLFAAREVYNFFTPASVLFAMFMTTIFVTFVSVRYNSQRLAIAGLVTGSIAPYFINAPEPDIVMFFSYLMVVVMGALWVVFKTGWSSLVAVAVSLVFFQSMPFLGDFNEFEQDLVLLFSFVFVAIFYVTNIVSLIYLKGKKHNSAQVYTAFATAIYLFVWVTAAASPQWQSLLYTAWALVFGVGAYLTYTLTSNRTVFYLYGGTALALIGAATAAELSGPVLTIAYTLEIGILLSMAAVLRSPKNVFTKLSLLFVVPIVLSVESLGASSWNSGVLHSDFAVLVLLTSVLFVTGLFIEKTYNQDKEIDESLHVLVRVLISSGVAYVVALIWLVLHAVLFDETATVLSLVIYTISGLALYIYGKKHDHKETKIAGVVFVTIVIARLLMVEVWIMSSGANVALFLAVGLLLVSTGFIKKSPKETSGDILK
ncbi:MAG: putative membrane protein [Acidimicrobiales bacterium]|jgi:uncharacterized membrane protein